MRRFVTLLAFVSSLIWSSVAFGGDGEGPNLRTSVAPTVGTGVFVHKKVGLAAQGQGRLMTNDEDPNADRAGMALRVGPRFMLARILTLGLDYGYAWGVYPLDGLGREEHSAQIGLRIGSSTEGRRLAVANRVRVDLRSIRVPGEDWRFRVRPRDEVAVSVIFAPWMRLSLLGEALASPAQPMTKVLQLRGGLALHGRIDLVQAHKWKRNRAAPALHWLVAGQFGLRPMALARDTVVASDTQPRSHETLLPPAVDMALAPSEPESVDMIITIGLSGQF